MSEPCAAQSIRTPFYAGRALPKRRSHVAKMAIYEVSADLQDRAILHDASKIYRRSDHFEGLVCNRCDTTEDGDIMTLCAEGGSHIEGP